MTYLVLHAFSAYGKFFKRGDIVEDKDIKNVRLRTSERKIIAVEKANKITEEKVEEPITDVVTDEPVADNVTDEPDAVSSSDAQPVHDADVVPAAINKEVKIKPIIIKK